MIQRLNHIGIAVRDLDASAELFGKLFQVQSMHRETVEEQLVAIASFRVGDIIIELTAPTAPESPIAKFLEKRGEGIHHLAFESDDISGELERVASEGIRLINPEPRSGAHDMLIAFLHPKSTHGVLTELCQSKPD